MNRVKSSDIAIIDYEYPYSMIVDYLRFVKTFPRGKKVSLLDPKLMDALKVNYPSHASQKLANLFHNGLLKRDMAKGEGTGRKPYLYYLPK
jgi:hypothetical protein